MIIVNSSRCKGASHDKSGKPCQDYCWSSDYDGLTIIIVSDGHGGENYFRSDVGSKIAVDVTKKNIEEFCDKFTLVSSNLIQRGILIGDSSSVDYTEHDMLHEKEFRQLFSNIANDWNREIMSHWDDNKPTLNEFENAGPSVAKYFSDVEENRYKIKKAYGCTLIAAVRTDSYWFAFHLGDGKCVAIKESGECFEPIPWDSRCFQNITTSLCQDNFESFRYCYSTEHVPALFIASDGIDDTYSNTESLFGFYQTVATMICENGGEYTKKYFDDNLYNISKKGSQDDMSIAYWCDVDKLKEMGLVRKIYQLKISVKENEIKNLKEKSEILETKINETGNQITNDMCLIEKLKKRIVELFSSHKREDDDLRNNEDAIDLNYSKMKGQYEDFCKSKDDEINRLEEEIKKIKKEKELKYNDLGIPYLEAQLRSLEKQRLEHEQKKSDIEKQEILGKQEISHVESEKLKKEVVLNQYKDDLKEILRKIKDNEIIIDKYRKKLNTNA